MLETRPMWIIVLALNVCIFIWLTAIQDPVGLSVSTTSVSFNSSFSNAKHTNNNNYNTDNDNDVSKSLLSLGLSGKFSDNVSKPERSNDSYTRKSSLFATLPPNDYRQLIDLMDYKLLMIQPECKDNVKALILVHSAAYNKKKRQIIRKTWGRLIINHYNCDNGKGNDKVNNALRLLFVVGAVRVKEMQDMLQAENDVHRDMIQGSFIDDYRNMTYKHVMAFKWFLYNCSNAQILIKVDDDVYLNTYQLLEYIKMDKNLKKDDQENNSNHESESLLSTIGPMNTTLFDQIIIDMYNNKSNINTFNEVTTSKSESELNNLTLSKLSKRIVDNFDAKSQLFQQPRNLLFCTPNINSLVKRSYRSKWRVSYNEYSGRYYPPYCPGYFIAYSADVVLRLYIAAQRAKYFWIDDIHITGTLAMRTGIPITTSSHYLLSVEQFNQLLHGKIDLNEIEFLVTWHHINEIEIFQLWRMQSLYYNKMLMLMAYANPKIHTIIQNNAKAVTNRTNVHIKSFS